MNAGGIGPVMAGWWPMREFSCLRGVYSGTWFVSIGQDGFVCNFGAVVDDFGNLVRVPS